MCCFINKYIFIDFDEETADDKDIDMGIYYGHSEGNSIILLTKFLINEIVEVDRDARQLLEMSREQRLRHGDTVKGIGAFEQHTKVHILILILILYIVIYDYEYSRDLVVM